MTVCGSTYQVSVSVSVFVPVSVSVSLCLCGYLCQWLWLRPLLYTPSLYLCQWLWLRPLLHTPSLYLCQWLWLRLRLRRCINVSLLLTRSAGGMRNNEREWELIFTQLQQHCNNTATTLQQDNPLWRVPAWSSS